MQLLSSRIFEENLVSLNEIIKDLGVSMLRKLDKSLKKKIEGVSLAFISVLRGKPKNQCLKKSLATS